MAFDDDFILAGFVAAPRWHIPPESRAGLLPATVATVSDCLVDCVPASEEPLTEPWHHDLATAHAAARAAGVYALSMNLAPPETAVLLDRFGGWGPADFHPLWRRLTHPVAAPPGMPLGFEVVGFEAGDLHSWLCNDLQRDAWEQLGITVNELGLLDDLDQARAVAVMADRDPGTEEVDWIAALVIEHQVPGAATESQPTS
ncbi:hypothetical protein [Hamadaea tsunoensis]|uniref:hypothetical protein n=1 Tax=Hamadaea tsunoensis TaxID=53368 RepID=UPI0003F8D75E|nr:hypothetical protein [Hamadaea tsunoensis]